MPKYVNPAHEKLSKSEVDTLVKYMKNALSQKKAHVKVTEYKTQLFGKPHREVNYRQGFSSHTDMMKVVRRHNIKLPDNFETSMGELRKFLRENHFKTHGELLIEELIRHTGELHIGNFSESESIKNPHTSHAYEIDREGKLYVPNYPRGIAHIMQHDNFMPIIKGI